MGAPFNQAMKCSLCGYVLLKDEHLEDHIRHHVWDHQYGVRQNGLVELLIHMMDRLDKLERAPKGMAAMDKEIEEVKTRKA